MSARRTAAVCDVTVARQTWRSAEIADIVCAHARLKTLLGELVVVRGEI